MNASEIMAALHAPDFPEDAKKLTLELVHHQNLGAPKPDPKTGVTDPAHISAHNNEAGRLAEAIAHLAPAMGKKVREIASEIQGLPGELKEAVLKTIEVDLGWGKHKAAAVFPVEEPLTLQSLDKRLKRIEKHSLPQIEKIEAAEAEASGGAAPAAQGGGNAAPGEGGSDAGGGKKAKSGKQAAPPTQEPASTAVN